MKKLNKTVKKLVIPAAGFGTRFLPVTKSIAKEMLPILTIPTIHYIVQEAIDAGIQDIVIVVSPQKNSIIDYFDRHFKLEHLLDSKNKTKELNLIKKISDMANIFFVRQKEQNGLGHAILCARQFIGDEPFAVILGDDLVFTPNNKPNALKQCINAFSKCSAPIVGVQKVPKSVVDKYGIIRPTGPVRDNVIKLKDMVEKPDPSLAPSQYAILGRYVLTPNIFDCLEKISPDKSGEIQLTDGIRKLIKMKKPIYACNFSGDRFDIGNVEDFLKATLYKSWENPKLKEIILDFISNKCN